MRKTLVICISFFILAFSADSQTKRRNVIPFSRYVKNTYTFENGLPQNTVDAIRQTSDGYLWVGTYSGAARFDGIKFLHYNQSITSAFILNHVNSFLEDNKGNLWLGTNGGGIIRKIGNNFTNLTELSQSNQLYIKTIDLDTNGDIIFSTERGGIYRIKIRDGDIVESVTPIILENLPANPLIRSFLLRKNEFWIGTDDGLFQYKDGIVSKFSTNNGLPSNSIQAFCFDNNNDLWIGTSNGVSKYDGERFQNFTTSNGLTSNFIRAVFVDRQNVVWIGTEGAGLNRIYTENQQYKIDSYSTRDGLVSDFIRVIYQDNEGSMWIGTRGGMNQFHPGISEVIGKAQGLSDSYVRSVFEDTKGRIWIGTNGSGIDRLDGSSIRGWDQANGLSNTYIRAIYQDMEGNMWFGSDGGGVYKYDERRNSFTNFSTANGLTENYIRSIQNAWNDELWIATYGGGISRLKNGKVTPLTTKEGLSNDLILAMVAGENNVMWVGTNGGGVNKITPKGIETITTANGLNSNFILSLYVDRDNVLWVGTNGGGINRIENGKIDVISTKNGLKEDVILMMIDDNLGYFWIGGNQGISRVKKSDLADLISQKREKIFRRDIDYTDGLQNAELSGVSGPCIINSSQGTLMFATVGGLGIIDPKQIPSSVMSLPIHIEEIKLDKTVYSYEHSLEFPPGDHALEFTYTALSFLSPNRIHFRYKLEGYNNDWIDAGTRRTAYFTNLSPGNYTLVVNATLDNENWFQEEASIDFTIEPYFHQTYSFYIILAIALMTLGAGLYEIRMYRIKKHAKELRLLVTEQTRDIQESKDQIEAALQDAVKAWDELAKANTKLDKANKEKSDLLSVLSHDLKNKVLNLKMFSQSIKSNTENKDTLIEYAMLIEQTTLYMLKLIEDTLSSAALEQGTLILQTSPINIVQLVELSTMTNRMHMQKKGQSLEFISNVEEDVKVLGDERWLNEAIDNVINNAGKFSPHGAKTVVIIDADASILKIQIKDQGPGLTDEDKKNLFSQFKRLSAVPTGDEISTGLGLAIVKKIVDLHHGKVYAESILGKGSTFTIELPLLSN